MVACSCVSAARACRFAPLPVVGCGLRSSPSALCSLPSSVLCSVWLLVASAVLSRARSALRLVLRSRCSFVGCPFVLLCLGGSSCRCFSPLGRGFVRLGVGFSHTLNLPIDKLRLLIYNLSVSDRMVKHSNYPRHGLRATVRSTANAVLLFCLFQKPLSIKLYAHNSPTAHCGRFCRFLIKLPYNSFFFRCGRNPDRLRPLPKRK